MMNSSPLISLLEIAAYVIGILGIGSGVFSFVRYGNYKTTVQLQNDSIKALQDNKMITDEALEKAREEIKALQLDSADRIGVLKGQVQLYKDLNLKDIADALIGINKSNTQILNTLKQSASTLATNTSQIAEAAKHVKQDLEESK
jgi:hypothetical protein